MGCGPLTCQRAKVRHAYRIKDRDEYNQIECSASCLPASSEGDRIEVELTEHFAPNSESELAAPHPSAAGYILFSQRHVVELPVREALADWLVIRTLCVKMF